MDGKKVVVKKNKSTKDLNEYLLIFTFSFISLILLHPTPPPKIGRSILFNEGWESRERLNKIGIPTPKLLDINRDVIVEEYINGGNLYSYLKNGGKPQNVYKVGVMTRKLHNNGYCFTDNKAQNYLLDKENIIRTDLGLIQKDSSIFSKSLDIGIFLASLLDLEKKVYENIERYFLEGYKYNSSMNESVPYLSVILRNIAALCLTSNYNNLANNLLIKSNVN